MTVDISIEVLVGGAVFLGGQIAILAQVVRSNRDQGRRLGTLEKWRAGLEAVEKDRTKRHRLNTAAGGVPQSDE
jgi:hypothetical protein